VLSVGKVGAHSADYYARQVAASAADYYLGHGEAAGYWFGAGADRLGLTGEVTEEQLRRLIMGDHPGSGIRLLDRMPAKRRPGFDITFSAPKSASVLYALGDDATRRAIRGAHDAAVADAMAYLERVACKVRRGRGGAQQLDAGGFVSAVFRQRTSRAGDPHLHTQVVTANMALGPDGRWTALDGRLIYLHGKTAGMLYAASLRQWTARELGLAWVMRGNGTGEVDGFPAGFLRRLSQRRQQVEQRMTDRGERSAAAAQVATLATRMRKADVPSYGELLPVWREVANEMGFDDAALHRLLGRRTPTPARVAVTDDVRRHLLGPAGLTEQRASFDRRDVLQALCRLLPDGATFDELEELADALLREREVIPILPVASRTTAAGGLGHDQAVRVDGTPAGAALAGQPRYTTADLLVAETTVLALADSSRIAPVAVATEQALAAALARRPTLSDEQVAMVRALTTSRRGVDLVVGKAGTGKTYALDAAREAWQVSGYTVIGATLAARAAAGLQAGSGIPSVTLTRLLGELGRAGGLPPDTVVVLDEAGMIGTRDLQRLMTYVAAAGAKLVLVGDPRQIPEIDAGGIFRTLIDRHGAVELVHNRRQIDPWEQVGLDELRHGDVTAFLEAFDNAGRIVIGTTAEDTRRLLVDGWWRDRQRWETLPADHPDKTYLPLMRAYHRDDVADLNARGRAIVAAAGRLSGPEVVTANGHRFAVGDAIVLTQNRYRNNLLNGDAGHVVTVDPARRALVVDSERGRLHVPAWYLDEGFATYGYARTGHKGQGETGETTHALYTDDLYRELGYVLLSRGREANTLYVTAATADGAGRDPFEAIRRGLSRSGAQRSAHDELAPAIPAMGLDVRRHSDAQLAGLVSAGERVERNQPPDVRGRITALTTERDWLQRRLAADSKRGQKLDATLVHTAPFARGRRRELRDQLELLNQASTAAQSRIDDIETELAELSHAHTTRLAWERHTAVVRDSARIASDELHHRARGDEHRDGVPDLRERDHERHQ
jgi:conjugative relaxase-like TrwC/TraI family protein